ncbi:MAG: hypothetical protein ACE5HD_01345 [Acidobacteriota bacterium]
MHKNVTLLEVDQPRQLEDLMALPEVRAACVRRLTPCSLVLDHNRLPQLLAALKKHEYLPRIMDRRET